MTLLVTAAVAVVFLRFGGKLFLSNFYKFLVKVDGPLYVG